MGFFKRDHSDWLPGTASVVSELGGLQLAVSVPGKTPYTVDYRDDVPAGWVGHLQGQSLPIRVDPKNDGKLEVDWPPAPSGPVTALAGPAAPPAATTVHVESSKVVDARNVPGLKEEILQALTEHGIQPGTNQTIDAGQVPGLGDELMHALAEHGIDLQSISGAPIFVHGPEPVGGEMGAQIERLKKLGELHSSGVLTDAEFAAAKKKILGS